MAPGTLCCFAGRILPAESQAGPGPSQGPGRTALAMAEGYQQQQQDEENELPAAFTHALHLRFQSVQARPYSEVWLEDVGHRRCKGLAQA